MYIRGRTLLVAAIIGLVIYIIVRWLIAWGYRISYWYQRGTKGIHSTSCPSCDQYIYRQRRDWILKCKRCGWTAGWPIIRWVTQSVPARQLRRTVVGPQLIVVILGISVLGFGGITGGIIDPASDRTTVDRSDSASSINSLMSSPTQPLSTPQTSPSPLDTPTSHSSPTPGPAVQQGYNRTLVEAHFIKLLNQERSSRGLQNVSQSGVLSDMGEEHSADMAEGDYIGHNDSNGRTIQDRYEERELLPECRLSIEGSDRYYPGAENAAGAWVERRFRSTGGSYFVSNEQELAEALFSIWMNSPPHRRAMLVHSADEAGLGLTITESGKVYAALELC